ncbi:MAG: aldehyde dehydrogenase family protein, partial [Burkholderiales bacterium]|nr:aldehyde dehydrogenase family protein [Burkholderiales bacterium]
MDLSSIRHLITEHTDAFLSKRHHRLLIDGQWVDAQQGGTFPTLNPATEEVVGEIASAGEADVDLAVRAARRALDEGPWGRLRPAERQRLLLKLADLVEAHAQTLAEIESIDSGKSAAMARAVDMALVVEFFRYMAGWATKIEG